MTLNDMHGAIACQDPRMGGLLKNLMHLTGVRTVRLTEDAFSSDGRTILKDVDFGVVALDPDGLETLSRLRRDPESPNQYLPIIAVGADLMIEDVRSAIHFGAHDVLALPASVAQLQKRIQVAVMAGRPWINTAAYVGPCRRRSLKNTWAKAERRANAAMELAGRAAREAQIARSFKN
jgi:CheY-like chemotaxis protein